MCRHGERRGERRALLLAGGDGLFLRAMTRELAGDDRPKQFCPSGAHLGGIELDVPVSYVAWREDGSVLFITAGTARYRIQTGTKGAGF
ncbi:MAG: hypothetical protein ACREMG_13625 [Gemmatimonadales bacterium]